MSYLRLLIQKRVIVISLIVAALYLLAQIFVLNNNLVISTLAHQFPLDYKITILLSLVVGYFGMFNPAHILVLLLTSLLIGLNISLLIAVGKRMSKNGRASLSLGGSGLLSLASVGCPTCSLSVFALFGSGGGFIGLLFSTWWMQAIILGALGLSIIVSLHSYNQKVCEVLPKS